MADVRQAWVGPLTELPDPIRERWRQWERSGDFLFHQSTNFAETMAVAFGSASVMVVWARGALGCFRLQEGRATSVLGGRAMVGRHDSAGIVALCEALAATCPRVRLVYFPLVDAAGGAWSSHADLCVWPRLPCPIIDWADAGATLKERVVRRLGSQATRRWRRFLGAGIRVGVAHAEEAVHAVRRVEERSWKAKARQSMIHQPGMWELYKRLIRVGAVSVQFAWAEEAPIAYRIDARHDCVVTCLKWSYDESFARLSPGFYLLTMGLLDVWGSRPLDYIDLHGSPDTLKAAVSTSSYRRRDVAWPRGAEAQALREERSQHDAAVWSNYEQQRGIRYLYERA